MSLKQQLQSMCRPDLWLNGGEFERWAMNNGFKASNASRRLRELENEGFIEKKIDNGSVWYRLIPKREVFKPEVITQQRILKLI